MNITFYIIQKICRYVIFQIIFIKTLGDKNRMLHLHIEFHKRAFCFDTDTVYFMSMCIIHYRCAFRLLLLNIKFEY